MKNFKLITLTFFFLGLINTAAFAQLSLGIKAGGSLSTTYGDSEEFQDEKLESISFRPGYQVGAFIGLGLTDAIKIIGEVAYEVRNGGKEVNVTVPTPAGNVTVNSEFENSFHYVNVPILLVLGSGAVKFYGGPNFAYLTKATSTNTVDNPAIGTTETEIDFKNDPAYEDFGSFINEADLGLNIGFMFQATEKVFLDLRINHGLTDATNNDYDNSVLDGSPREDTDRNVSVQLSAGLNF